MARGCIRRRAGVVGLLAGTGLLLPAHGEPLPWRAADARPSYNLYGVTGLIDMPSAESQPDGQIAFTTSWMGGELRNTLNFQILPRIDGSFRYSILNDYFDSGSSLYHLYLFRRLRQLCSRDSLLRVGRRLRLVRGSLRQSE